MIRYPRLTAVAALSALAFIGCGGEQKPAEIPTTEPAASAAAPTPTTRADAAAATTAAPAASPPAEIAAPSPGLSDEQIAAITEAANTAEIDQAKLAEAKSKNAEVKRFAAMMIKHHGEAKAKQAKLKFQSADSPDSTAMKADASNTLDTLKKDTGKEFDKAYIDAQVEGHQKVLEAINEKLLPNVKSPELKAYLDEVKPRVEEHLKVAKGMQQTFDKNTPATDAAAKHGG